MNRHAASKQKPVPNFPSAVRPSNFNSVIGRTVLLKSSACIAGEIALPELVRPVAPMVALGVLSASVVLLNVVRTFAGPDPASGPSDAPAAADATLADKRHAKISPNCLRAEERFEILSVWITISLPRDDHLSGPEIAMLLPLCIAVATT